MVSDAQGSTDPYDSRPAFFGPPESILHTNLHHTFPVRGRIRECDLGTGDTVSDLHGGQF
jgi:hypothetical protein